MCGGGGGAARRRKDVKREYSAISVVRNIPLNFNQLTSKVGQKSNIIKSQAAQMEYNHL